MVLFMKTLIMIIASPILFIALLIPQAIGLAFIIIEAIWKAPRTISAKLYIKKLEKEYGADDPITLNAKACWKAQNEKSKK